MSIPGQFNTLAMFSAQTSNFKFILLFHIWISSSLCPPAPFQNFHLPLYDCWHHHTESHGPTKVHLTFIHSFTWGTAHPPIHVTLSNLTHLLWHNIQQPGCCLWISGPDHICTNFTPLCPDQQFNMASSIECVVYLCIGLYFTWPAVVN